MRKTIVFVALLAALGVLSAPAIAGGKKPTSTSGYSVALQPLNRTTGNPKFGDNVTFSYTSPETYVWVDARCYQGGTQVYSETRGFFPQYPWGQTYTLGPTSMWTSGGALCHAALITTSHNRTVVLATTDFSVDA